MNDYTYLDWNGDFTKNLLMMLAKIKISSKVLIEEVSNFNSRKVLRSGKSVLKDSDIWY